MDALKVTICELREHFDTKMADFQRSLQASANPASSPTSNIAAQFNVFRTFIISALEGLQAQLGLLACKQEELEMRTRRKILLVHGIQESKNEKVASVVVEALSERLKIPDLKTESISRCHRLGRAKTNKPRAILIKFRDLGLRNKIWYAKTGLKNSGITLSEFLTKDRHGVFTAARQRFGVDKCWTRNGYVIVMGSDGAHNRITTLTELNSLPSSSGQIPSTNNVTGASATTSANTPVHKEGKSSYIRPKRVVKK